MDRIMIFLIVLQILFIHRAFGEIRLTEVVHTHKGPVRGKILKTLEKSVEYSAFRGIPYGKPPVGYLRFKPPVEVDAWTNVVNATNKRIICPQIARNEDFQIVGNEDCLHLNVYTPKTKFNSTNNTLLAVMVWIHSGGFYEGSSSVYGPDFLIEENVVVVAMNYRLGALGFLSLGHPNATGNAGLKDQVLALKWVQQNIEVFGGNPNEVTLFGHSAGADSVELHKISNLSRGLFSRSIAMSGSPLNPWAFEPTNVAILRATKFGDALGITAISTEGLLKQLYNIPVERLVEGTVAMIASIDLPFKPTVEDIKVAGESAFLTECPINVYRQRNFQQTPHILGFVGAETMLVVPNIVYAVTDPNALIDKQEPVWDYESNTELMEKSIEISAGLWFVAGIDRTQQYLSRGSAPVYYYRNNFDYPEALHRLEGFNISGTAHMDDVLQIFWLVSKNQSLDSASDIGIQRRKMVKMWTNFAKFANPTPNGTDDKLLNAEWRDSRKDGSHLEIDNTGLTMQPRPTDIFNNIFKEFLRPVEGILNGCQL